MSDAPIQTILQQRDARPVSGEHLEVLGKRAAADWVNGKTASLNQAIVDTVRAEQLSPEQVRRVVEFCNGDAYLQEFRKEGSHRVVHFDCGPADPSQVLQDLNDGGGGSVYDRGDGDYSRSPRAVHKEAASKTTWDVTDGEKTASIEVPVKQASPYDADLDALFNNGRPAHIPFHNPLQPLIEVRDKLAGGRDQAASELTALEIDYAEAGDQLYRAVKQAALEGVSLADVVTAFAQVTTDDVYTKIAFRLFTPRFQREGIFQGYDAIGASLMKQASAGEVNSEHPIVKRFAEFHDALCKLANMRVLEQEFADGAAQAELLMKQAAAGGLLGAAKQGIGAASAGIDAASPAIAQFLVGAKDAKGLAPTLSKGLKGTALVGGALAGNAALQSVTDRPAVRSGLNAAQSLVPGTAAYQERRYRNMTGQ